jgi:hypothetical protein
LATLLKIGSPGKVLQLRKTFDHLPAWKCISFKKGVFYLCGGCFAKLGSGPATNSEEIWTPGTDRNGDFHYDVVPRDARCHDCSGRAWPHD